MSLPEHPSTQPPPEDRPIHGRRVALGIGAVFAVHALLLTLAIVIPLSTVRSSDQIGVVLSAIVGAELVLFVSCLVVGILQLVRGDRGVGVGLLVGWAVSVIVMPVVGFGVCVAIVSSGTVS
jgi:hypothetical protein